MAEHGGHHGLVAEDRLARERRENVRGHAHARQNGDVHLGMAEEPEQVLPQQRRAALVIHDVRVADHQPAGNEEAGAGDAVQQQQDARRQQHAERQQAENRGDRTRPTRSAACASSVMPLARRSSVVVMKFSAPSSEAMQKIPMLMIHRSGPAPWPGPAIWPSALSGGYAVQPASGAPPVDEERRRPARPAKGR